MLDSHAVDQVVALLRTVPLFAGLPDRDLAWIAAGLHHHAYPPGALISREGERSRFFSILLEGEIAVYKSLGQPEERLLTVMQAGDFFGEMSLYEAGPGDEAALNQRSASLVARDLVLVLELPIDAFKELLNRQPGVAYRVMQVMAARLRNLESATITDLREKNRRLAQALDDLQQAQAQLVEKEKLEHELDMARRIQERMLPKQLPGLPGWLLDARWQPARAVSGDFYDFLPMPDGRLGIVIGDVTGKGVPASLVMATTCSVLRAAARTLSGRRRTPGRRRTGQTGVFANPFKNNPPRPATGQTGVVSSPFKINPPPPSAGQTGVFAGPFQDNPPRPPAEPPGPIPGSPASAPGAPDDPDPGQPPGGVEHYPTGEVEHYPTAENAPQYLPARLSPAVLLAQVNELLCREMPPAMFAACIFGLLDPGSGELTFANAGHCLPLQLHPSGLVGTGGDAAGAATFGGLGSRAGSGPSAGSPPAYLISELRATGMPLGLLPESEYDDQTAHLAPGDRLLLYSDGLVEAHHPNGDMLGVPALRRWLAYLPGNIAPDGMVETLLAHLEAYTGPGQEQEDDVTLVALERQ